MILADFTMRSHLRPFRPISILYERLIPDKQNKLVAVNRQFPEKIQVGQVMLRHGFIDLDIHLVEISVCFLNMNDEYLQASA